MAKPNSPDHVSITICDYQIMAISSAKYHFFHVKQKKCQRTINLLYFFNLPCPKRERYYICRLKVLRIGEVAQLVRAHDS